MEDHAILLCSLLLGWGLDAWVAYGTIYPNSGADDDPSSDAHSKAHQHYWVVTLDALRFDASDDKSEGVSNNFVTFWG